MSELKGCLVSTGSDVCWAVLTYVIGLSLSVLLFRLVNEPCASVPLQGDSLLKNFTRAFLCR